MLFLLFYHISVALYDLISDSLILYLYIVGDIIMISNLHIQNFKAWKDTGNITLSPITILFGSNSSGKSSLEQFLMFLKQSVLLNDPRTVLFPGNAQSTVDLGLPSDIIYNRDIDRLLAFSYKWKLERAFYFNNAIKKKVYKCTNIEFEAEVKVNDKTTQSMEVEKFIYKLYSGSRYLFSIGMQRKETRNAKRSYQMIFENYEAVRAPGRVWDITPPIKFFGFPEEAIAYYQNIGFARNLNTFHTKMFSNISYLGPLRTKAARLYTWTGTTPIDVGDDGGNTVAAILGARAQKRSYNFKDRQKLQLFDEVIAKMLKSMALIDDFKVEKIAPERQEYEVKVQTRGSKLWVDIPDVGFGISQVLPVLTQLFYAPPNSTIIIEQPELHLHPSAQAALADVMINAILAREKASERNIQLIIETHSEHFLRRLQRRIAEKVVSESKVSAYFANVSHLPVELDPLQIDLYGNIVNWPKEFFGDIDSDIYLQANAALNRKITESE